MIRLTITVAIISSSLCLGQPWNIVQTSAAGENVPQSSQPHTLPASGYRETPREASKAEGPDSKEYQRWVQYEAFLINETHPKVDE